MGCKYNFCFILSSFWYNIQASRLQEIAGNSSCIIKLYCQVLYICLHKNLGLYSYSDTSASVNRTKFGSHYSPYGINSSFPHGFVWCRYSMIPFRHQIWSTYLTLCTLLYIIFFLSFYDVFTGSTGTNEERMRDWDMKLFCTIPFHVLRQNCSIMCQLHMQETVHEVNQLHSWFGRGNVLYQVCISCWFV